MLESGLFPHTNPFLNVKKFKTILNDGFIMIFQIIRANLFYIFCNTQSVFGSAKPVPRVKTAFLQPFIVVKR